jgi:hypothetical protein
MQWSETVLDFLVSIVSIIHNLTGWFFLPFFGWKFLVELPFCFSEFYTAAVEYRYAVVLEAGSGIRVPVVFKSAPLSRLASILKLYSLVERFLDHYCIYSTSQEDHEAYPVGLAPQ